MRCQDVAWVRGALSLGVVLGSRCEAVGVELNARPGELGGGISPSYVAVAPLAAATFSPRSKWPRAHSADWNA